MEYPKPFDTNFTVYTVTKCGYCNRFKHELRKHGREPPEVILCDEFVSTPEQKRNFFAHVNTMTTKPHYTFPIIFHNGKYIGGFTDSCAFLESTCSAFDK